MKKFLVMALFGLVGFAAFAGTCVVTHISLVSTDGTHKTFAGQLDNTSGVNILQHNFVVAFLDSGNNVLGTATVPGCLRSVQNNTTDYFSAVSAASSGNVATGLARIAFDSTFKVGTTSSQNVSISNVGASRSTTTLTVSGKVTNNASNTLVSPNACIVVRTSAGNVLITSTISMSDIAAAANRTFSGTITVPDDSSAASVDVWVDGLDSSANPTTPQSNLNTSVNTGTPTPVATATTVANKLAFSTQPVGGASVGVLATQPVVQVQTSGGALVSGSTASVTLAVKAGTAPAGTVLTCTTNPVTAVGGVATFAGCSLNHAATGIVLTATSTGLTSADSAAIAINPGATTHIAFTQSPSNSNAATIFGMQPQVALLDANNDVVWTDVASTVGLTLNGAGALTCTSAIPLTVSQGVAAFVGCKISLAGIGDSLSATSGAFGPVTSATFDIGDQTITFAAIANHPGTDLPLTLPTPTASSGLTVVLTSTTPGACTVAGFVVTRVSAAVCTLHADQAGNTLWNAAPTVVQSFTITS